MDYYVATYRPDAMTIYDNNLKEAIAGAKTAYVAVITSEDGQTELIFRNGQQIYPVVDQTDLSLRIKDRKTEQNEFQS